MRGVVKRDGVQFGRYYTQLQRLRRHPWGASSGSFGAMRTQWRQTGHVRCTIAGSRSSKRQMAAGEAWPGVRRLMDGREGWRGRGGWSRRPARFRGSSGGEARHPCWLLRLASATFRMRAWLSCRFGRSRRAKELRKRHEAGDSPDAGARTRRKGGEGWWAGRRSCESWAEGCSSADSRGQQARRKVL